MDYWIKESEEKVGLDIYILGIIANKIDLDINNQNIIKEGESFAKSKEAKFLSFSAKTDPTKKLDIFLCELVQEFLIKKKNMKIKENNQKNNVDNNKTKENNKEIIDKDKKEEAKMQPKEEKENIKPIKSMFLGESWVVKTSLIARIITNHFDENIETTYGSCYATKKIKIYKKEYDLDLWDINTTKMKNLLLLLENYNTCL